MVSRRRREGPYSVSYLTLDLIMETIQRVKYISFRRLTCFLLSRYYVVFWRELWLYLLKVQIKVSFAFQKEQNSQLISRLLRPNLMLHLFTHFSAVTAADNQCILRQMWGHSVKSCTMNLISNADHSGRRLSHYSPVGSGDAHNQIPLRPLRPEWGQQQTSLWGFMHAAQTPLY